MEQHFLLDILNNGIVNHITIVIYINYINYILLCNYISFDCRVIFLESRNCEFMFMSEWYNIFMIVSYKNYLLICNYTNCKNN